MKRYLKSIKEKNGEKETLILIHLDNILLSGYKMSYYINFYSAGIIFY